MDSVTKSFINNTLAKDKKSDPKPIEPSIPKIEEPPVIEKPELRKGIDYIETTMEDLYRAFETSVTKSRKNLKSNKQVKIVPSDEESDASSGSEISSESEVEIVQPTKKAKKSSDPNKYKWKYLNAKKALKKFNAGNLPNQFSQGSYVKRSYDDSRRDDLQGFVPVGNRPLKR